MHKKIAKLNEIVKHDLEEMMVAVNDAGTITPEQVEIINDAACLMLKLEELKKLEMEGKIERVE